MSREDEQYTDFTNVETQRTFLTAEEFPEGFYGSPRGVNEPVKNKETPWTHGQQYYSNSSYEFRNLHQDLPRQFPAAHHTHDEDNKDREEPYKDAPL
ncbi:hypothetical protein [Bacillus suaedae]|uniref:Cytosolic protein n=1 Tax=Halalkalibacter suaedae TaxID=2822140 RepID=A0A940WUM6_9BACI|nr:hypothetical protein [Bacillus suaedae]MBP3953059.1 hypothetical protein [Bacillus suaedae]